MNKNSKIYITGHAGMVGKTLLQRLKKDGYKNLLFKTSKQLDLTNEKQVDSFYKKNRPEYVFHLAAKVGGIGVNVKYPVEFLNINARINLNVIDYAYKHKVKKLLYLGSSCIYPKQSKQPMKEEYLLSGKLEPTNEGYALSKIMGMKLCQYYYQQYKANFISLMAPNLYGVNEKFNVESSHVIAGLMMRMHEAKNKNKKSIKAWGTGKARREFLYVEDLVDGLIYFMKKYNAKKLYPFINIGSNKDISIKKLAQTIKKIVGFEGELIFDRSKPDGMLRKLMDSSRVKKLNWKIKTDLEAGIKKTYNYYLNTLDNIS